MIGLERYYIYKFKNRKQLLFYFVIHNQEMSMVENIPILGVTMLRIHLHSRMKTIFKRVSQHSTKHIQYDNILINRVISSTRPIWYHNSIILAPLSILITVK